MALKERSISVGTALSIIGGLRGEAVLLSLSLVLYPGYVSRLGCQGKLWVASIGNPALIELEALPKEIGCGVVLKPKVTQGRSNLLLETSAGTHNLILEIRESGLPPKSQDLILQTPGGSL